MATNHIFPLKVWLTSVLTGPVLFMFKNPVPTAIDFIVSVEFVEFYIYAILMGGFYSIPCFLVLWLCYSLLLGKNISGWLTRIILVLVSLLCCVIIFVLVSLPNNLKHLWSGNNLKLMTAYALSLIIGISTYRVTNVNHQSSNDIQ